MSEDRSLVFVGTYTTPVPHAPGAHGEGVHILELDYGARRARSLLVHGEVANPSYLCFDAGRRMLYATGEAWTGEQGTVASLSFSDDFSEVLEFRQLSSAGMAPCYVSTFGTRLLLLANYGDGSLVSFGLGEDGHLREVASRVELGEWLDSPRRDGPHAHCILPDPSGSHAHAADLGSDSLHTVIVDEASGSLHLGAVTPTTVGSGPRHLAWHPSGRVLCIHELNSELEMFSVAADGYLRAGQRVSALPAGEPGTSYAADIVVTRDGRHAYASNRGHDSIATCEIDSDTGGLRILGWQPSGGRTPRSLALSADDRHLLVANQDSDALTVFELQRPSGEPRQLFTVDVATPARVTCAP